MPERHRWGQERRKKEPTLYDEYMTEGRRAPQSYDEPSQPLSIPAQGATIRSVTPDSDAAEPLIVQPKTTSGFERDFLGLSSSPVMTTISSQEHERQPASTRDHGSRQDSHDSSRSEGQSTTARRRTTTDEDGTGRAKSSTGSKTGRPRHGSAQLPANFQPPLPIRSRSDRPQQGLPSSVSQPVLSTPSQFGQDTAIPRSTTARFVTGAGPLPTPNSRRIVQLMKTLAGRFAGNCAYRRSYYSEWKMAFCIIKESDATLVCGAESGTGAQKTLIANLRGCETRCLVEDDTGVPYLAIAQPQALHTVHLQLPSSTDLDSWYAALLCWQEVRQIAPALADAPLRPQGFQLSSITPGTQGLPQSSSLSALKEAPVIKVGQMIYWDTEVVYRSVEPQKSSSRPLMTRSSSYTGSRQYGLRRWRRVSAQLRENGELKFTEAENKSISTLHLSQLSRSAIQKLDSSVLGHDNCIAIYPQYTSAPRYNSSARPILLSLDTSVLFEVWFVLLRAFTTPQLYGSASTQKASTEDADDESESTGSAAHDMFRMERGLSLSIIEAKFYNLDKTKMSPDSSSSYTSRHATSPKQGMQTGYFVEVQLDGQARGKTLVKYHETNPFWNQDFEFADLPAVLTSATVSVKSRLSETPASSQKEQKEREKEKSKEEARAMQEAKEPLQSADPSGHSNVPQAFSVGKVEITLDELNSQKRSESWWPILDTQNKEVGSLLIRAKAEEFVVLLQREYEPLVKLLHELENGLTLQILNTIPGELKRLSEAFVNTFQVSGRSTEWLMTLIEDEIDGPSKESPLIKARYNSRLGSVDYDGTGPRTNDREALVRDMNKTAALEANLLFRGNTLLTKCLDAHMRRVGADYLFLSLGTIIRMINDRDPDCEVDPMKVSSHHDLHKNWSRLNFTTGEVWTHIRTTAQKCPMELRMIFRHIKACAEDRYGDFLRTVSFSSVSGFLFLRFFCPAVLSPKLFGLLKDDPKPRAKRTFVLVAKSLQTMANVATFGSKEPWMEPMNAFLNQNRESFKRFIDEVCYVPPPPAALTVNPSYSTPMAIKSRLPAQNKEGFPSLPYLLDEGRVYANLVDLWLHATQSSPPAPSILTLPDESPLRNFHELCRNLQERSLDCLARADRADRSESQESTGWNDVAGNSAATTAVSSPRNEMASPAVDITPIAEGLPWPGEVPVPGSAQRPLFRRQQSSSAGPSSPVISPQTQAGKDWSNNVAAAAAAVTILSQDRNPRSGFVIPSTSTSSAAVATAPSPPQPHLPQSHLPQSYSVANTNASSPLLGPKSPPTEEVTSNRTGSMSARSGIPTRNASLSLSTAGHRSPSIASAIARPGSASPAMSGTPVSTHSTGGTPWGVPQPQRSLSRSLYGPSPPGAEELSRPASALSGRGSMMSNQGGSGLAGAGSDVDSNGREDRSDRQSSEDLRREKKEVRKLRKEADRKEGRSGVFGGLVKKR